MATAIVGYPMTTNYCPSCGSDEVDADDTWSGSAKCKCLKCGKVCYVIEDDESEE